jgi:hypothetical protein
MERKVYISVSREWDYGRKKGLLIVIKIYKLRLSFSWNTISC